MSGPASFPGLGLDGRPLGALLLDLDDTILDYSSGVDDSWAEACHGAAGDCGVDGARLAAQVAKSRRWFWDDPVRHLERHDMLGAWTKIAADALERLGAPAPTVAARLAEDFAARRWQVMRLFPGALDTLEALHASGLPMALVTNGDRRQQRRKIEQFGIGRFFDVVVIEGEFGVGKPDESVYRHALAGLRAAPETAAMIGDHLEWDVAGPMRLGLGGIWVDAAGQGVPAGSAVKPDRVIRHLPELLARGL
jgi:putative hydrolase of the HAD superfamily